MTYVNLTSGHVLYLAQAEGSSLWELRDNHFDVISARQIFSIWIIYLESIGYNRHGLAPKGDPMQTAFKPQPVRQAEARARSKANRVRLEVLNDGKLYQSRSTSRPGLVHTLRRDRDGWRCSCEGYSYSGICQHLAGLERRLMREGKEEGFKIARWGGYA